jgi:hypothetical protein
MRLPPPIPNHRRRVPVPPPRGAGDPSQSGTIAKVDPQSFEQTPTLKGRADQVPYQALKELLDKATPLEQLEIVELATLGARMTKTDRRWLIETAARLPKEDEGP